MVEERVEHPVKPEPKLRHPRPPVPGKHPESPKLHHTRP